MGEATPEGGEIFNDYENNQAIAQGTHAEGNATVAGVKVFNIQGEYEETSMTLTLENEESGSWLVNNSSLNTVYQLSNLNSDSHISFLASLGYYYSFNFTDASCFEGGSVTVLVEYNGNYKFTCYLVNLTTGKIFTSSEVTEVDSGFVGLSIFNNHITPNVSKLESTITSPYYTLDSVNGLEVGDIYSIKFDSNYDLRGKITSIDSSTNRIGVSSWVNPFNDTSADKLIAMSSLGILWIPAKPTIGTTSWGYGQHAEGWNSYAVGTCSHTEGVDNISAGRYSHTEGRGNIAGYSAHSEGRYNQSLGYDSHTEGRKTIVKQPSGHAEGTFTVVKGNSAHAEGLGVEDKLSPFYDKDGVQQGYNPDENYGAHGNASHSEGSGTLAKGDFSHSEGQNTKAIGKGSHAEGVDTYASGIGSHSEGIQTTSSGRGSHAEGLYNSPSIRDIEIEGAFTNGYSVSYESEGISSPNGYLIYDIGRDIGYQIVYSVQVNYERSPYLLTPNTCYSVTFSLSSNSNNTQLTVDLLRGSQLTYSPDAPKEFLVATYLTTLDTQGSVYQITLTFITPNEFDTDNTPDKVLKNRLFFRIKGNAPQNNVKVTLYDLTISKPYLSTIGNGSSTKRKNAVQVFYDGHVEVETSGNTDSSLVTKKYVDNSVRAYTGNTFANALKNSKSGASILIDDISPVTHNMSVQLSSYTLGDKYVTYAEGGGSFDNPLYFSYRPSIRIKTNGYPSSFYPKFYFRDGGTSELYTPGEAGVTGASYDIYEFVGNSLAFSFYNDSEYTDLVYSETRELDNTSGIIGVAIQEWEETVHFTVETNCVPMIDFSSVIVSRYGKNLFDVSKITNINNLTNNGDGTLTTSANAPYGTIRETLTQVCPILKTGDNIVFSFSSPGRQYIYLQKSRRVFINNSKYTITQDDLDSQITFYGYESSDTEYGQPCLISNIQIELGTVATDYMPYVEPTEYTPNADGTVEGIASLYPTTILSTGTDGVIIDCEYNRDINKAFAELTQAIISLGGNV